MSMSRGRKRSRSSQLSRGRKRKRASERGNELTIAPHEMLVVYRCVCVCVCVFCSVPFRSVSLSSVLFRLFIAAICAALLCQLSGLQIV